MYYLITGWAMVQTLLGTYPTMNPKPTKNGMYAFSMTYDDSIHINPQFVAYGNLKDSTTILISKTFLVDSNFKH